MTGARLTRRTFLGRGGLVVSGLALGPAVFEALGCHRNGESAASPEPPLPDGAPAALDGGPASDAAAEAAPAAAPAPDPRLGLEPRLDLAEHLHLADVDHLGLFVDFGTPARHKYTLGHWRTGWGDDDREGDRTFTWATESPARLYFHLERPGPLQLVLRAMPRGTDRISVYLNDRPVDSVVLPAGWSEQVLAVEAAQTRAGENALKLVHSGRGGRTPAFAVDALRIVPGERAPVRGEGYVEPSAASLIAATPSGGRVALRLRTPTRLSWFLDVPAEVGLGFAATLASGDAARLAVTVTSARTGEARRVHESTLASGASPRPEIVDLAAFGGEVARLDLEVAAEGEAAGGEVLVAAPALLGRPPRVEVSSPPEARHVVVLLIDTLRADRLTVYSPSTRVESPEMERFAREATLFERCQAPANWTKPSCASVLTGLHPPSHRALTEGNALPRSVSMVSELFGAAGFRTGAFIANGYLAADFGFDRGWDRYRNYIRERRSTEAEHVFEEVGDWMEANRERRMFVYVQTIDPHVPYDPPDEDLRRYDPRPYSGPVRNRSTGYLLEDFKTGRVELSPRDRERLAALYDGEVTYHDRWFGRFLERLRVLGLEGSTLLLVTADHGEEFFEHGSVGHGHSLYQELLHVPLLARMPGLTRAGARLGSVCSLVDVAPTALSAAGLEVPAVMEGRSLVPDLRGAPPPPLGAAFSSQWDTGNARELSWAARVGDWKLRMHGPAISYLTDLANDPLDARDVDDAFPIALRAARIALGQFLGAEDRRAWSSRAAPVRGRAPVRPRDEGASMTPELCEQLRALGYLDIAECGH